MRALASQRGPAASAGGNAAYSPITASTATIAGQRGSGGSSSSGFAFNSVIECLIYRFPWHGFSTVFNLCLRHNSKAHLLHPTQFSFVALRVLRTFVLLPL